MSIYFLPERLKNYFEHIPFIILCGLSAILVYPLVIPIATCLFIYRLIIKIFVRLTNPRCGSMLTGMNAVLADREPYTKPLVLVSPYIAFVTKLDRDNIIQVLNDQIIKPNLYPELKQRIVRKRGYYFWHPVDNFDVERHVKYLNPECPNELITRKQLRRLGIEQMGALPFDSSLSPWDIVLVPNLVDETNPAVKSAVFVRANHCLMDGYSMINFIRKCAIKPWIVPAAQAYLKQKKGMREMFKSFLQILELLFVGPYHAVNMFVFSNDESHFLKRALSPASHEERNWGVNEVEPRRIEGERLRKLRKALNVSMSSLLLTMCVEGTVRFIRLKCNKKFSELPKKMYLQMAFPLPGHPDAMTNHWSAVRFTIGLNKDSDPVKRLECINRQFDYFKSSVVPLVIFIATKIIGSLPVKFLPRIEQYPLQTIILTSMPGPVEKVDMFGYEWDCVGLSGSPAIGSAFVIACQNYLNKFWIDVGGVGTLFKSQQDLRQAENLIHEVLEELECTASRIVSSS